MDSASFQTWAAVAVTLTDGLFPYKENEVETWEASGLLLPHALTATAYAEAAPVANGRLLNQMGLYLRGRADFTLAKIVLERAIKIGEATYRPDHPEVAVWVNNLGLVLQDMGDMAGAKDNYKRALEIDEAIYGPNHPNVAAMVNNLAGVLSKMGNLEGAKSLYERALRIDEATYGPNHSEVATDVNNLGSVLKDMGDLAGAKANYERALRIRRQFLGDDHLDTKSVQGWLADVMAALAAQQKQGQGQQLGETHAVDKAVGKPGKGWWPWLKR